MRPDKSYLPHYLYRHFDHAGDLLYIGISLSAVARTYTHSTSSHWFSKIRRIEILEFPNRTDALNAEAEAIARESPRYNVAIPRTSSLDERDEYERVPDDDLESGILGFMNRYIRETNGRSPNRVLIDVYADGCDPVAISRAISSLIKKGMVVQVGALFMPAQNSAARYRYYEDLLITSYMMLGDSEDISFMTARIFSVVAAKCASLPNNVAAQHYLDQVATALHNAATELRRHG